jgi:hypothetical protein
MMTKKQNNREVLIERLKQLLKGEITKDELRPTNVCMMIGWGENDDGSDGNLYLVNSMAVDREAWDKAINSNRRQYGTGTFQIEYD